MESKLLKVIEQRLADISFFTDDIRHFLLDQAQGMDDAGQQDILNLLEEYIEGRKSLDAEYKENRRLLDNEVTHQLGRLIDATKALQRYGQELFASAESDTAEDFLNQL